MYSNTLISTDELAAHLGDPHWIIIDCRFSLADTEHGRRAYAKAHIPGAHYL
ncbi:MAG: sulfurtransferase, partial [Rhodocyclaceae bacterium]